ncbi:MAG: hypothetical protein ACLR9A_01550 [Alistipes putredinis]|uniref:hypothetical protein n=1 Tax=Alistipes putredinis TaxID=28117 RepID=UPI0039A2F299
MALQPEIRTDSLEGQLPDSLPATEAALRESIFRLRDSLATIPPDTLPSAPPSQPKSCSEPVRHS